MDFRCIASAVVFFPGPFQKIKIMEQEKKANNRTGDKNELCGMGQKIKDNEHHHHLNHWHH